MASNRRFTQKEKKSPTDEYELKEYSVKRSAAFDDSDSEAEAPYEEYESDTLEKKASPTLELEKNQNLDPYEGYQELIALYENDASNLLQDAMNGKFCLEAAQKLINAFGRLGKVIPQDRVPQMTHLNSHMYFDMALAHLNSHSIRLWKNEDVMDAEEFFIRLSEIYDSYKETIDKYSKSMNKSTPEDLLKITIDQYPELKQSIEIHESQIADPKQTDRMVLEVKLRKFLEKMQSALNNLGSSSFLDQKKPSSNIKAPDDLKKFKHTLLQEIAKKKSNIEKLSTIRVYLEEQQSLCKIASTKDGPAISRMILEFLEEIPRLEETDKTKESHRSSPINVRQTK